MSINAPTGTSPVFSLGSVVVGPSLIAEIPYTEFSAGSSVNKYLDGSIKRNAKRRVFIFSNSMDQTISQTRVNMYESTMYNNHRFNGQNLAITTPPNVGMAIADSEESQQRILGAPTDSIHFSLSFGTTPPTSGKLEIWVTEVL